MKSDVLGIIELDSIAAGYLLLDAVIKAAPVTILKAEMLNPGKFIIFLTGDLASVEFSMDAGLEVDRDNVLYHLLIKNLHTQIFPALQKSGDSVNQGASESEPGALDAIGLIETHTIASAIEAADMAAKTAEIRIRSIVSGNETGGKGVTTISGELGDVESAMDLVVEYLNTRNQLFRKVVIPGPPVEMKGFLSGN